MELQSNRPPDKSVHMAGYSREDPGDLEFCEMVMVGLMPPPIYLDVQAVCTGGVLLFWSL